MARPKVFDEDKVLQAAMMCFWRHGYQATSMKDLESATGLTPGSIYNSFGSKNALFINTLDHYIDGVVRYRVSKYLLEGDPVVGINQFFFDGVKLRTQDAGRDIGYGCLLINTCTELGPHDETIRKKLVEGMSVAERGLTTAIKRAQHNGQMPASINAESRARVLGLLLNGMLVNCKVARPDHWLDDAMGQLRVLLH